MRHSTPQVAALALLSIAFLFSNGNPVIRTCVGVNCDQPESLEWGIFDAVKPRSDLASRSPVIRPPRISKPNDQDVNTNPDDGTGNGGSGRQSGNSDSSQTTVSGTATHCTRKRSWKSLWRRVDCQIDWFDPNNNFPPSARNNNKQPATGGDRADPAASDKTVINVAARKAEFETKIQNGATPNGPWYFYTGLDYKDVNLYKNGMDLKLGSRGPTGYIRNLLPDEADGTGSTVYKSAGLQWYYWAANSKAFAPAVQGDVYLVIPPGKAINQARSDSGTVWWSYEVPELTRSGRIDNIYMVEGEKIVDMEADPVVNEADLGPQRKVWKRGDEPLGFPADELYNYVTPAEPLNL